MLKDKVYKNTINPKHGGYQGGLATILYKFFHKKKGSEMNVNEVLLQELQKQIKRKKVYARFKDNICAADLDEIGLLSSFNLGFKYLLGILYKADPHPDLNLQKKENLYKNSASVKNSFLTNLRVLI